MDFAFATPASAGAASDFGTASGTDSTAGTDHTVLSSTETPRAKPPAGGVAPRHIVFEHDGVSTVARPRQAAAGHPPAAYADGGRAAAAADCNDDASGDGDAAAPDPPERRRRTVSPWSLPPRAACGPRG